MQVKGEKVENGEAEPKVAEGEPTADGEGEEEEEEDAAEEPVLEDEEGAELLLAPAVEQEQFNEALKERLKADVDRFEEMVVHEEEIRLGDEGWKGRYYKVRLPALLKGTHSQRNEDAHACPNNGNVFEDRGCP